MYKESKVGLYVAPAENQTFSLCQAVDAEMYLARKCSIVFVIIDLCLIVVALYCVHNFNTYWPATTKRGFFCDDESLKYPYAADTVSRDALYWLARDIPFVVVALLELCMAFFGFIKQQQLKLWPLYRSVRCFLYGYIAVTLLKNIGKRTTGRLRPHFFEVCKPVFADGTTCSTHMHDGIYQTNYTCTGYKYVGITENLVQNTRASFPSSHASLIFYGMIFLVCYIEFRLKSLSIKWLNKTLVLPFVQLACILLAWLVALSRIMDYKHHWSDVAVGSSLGAVVAYISTRSLLKERHKFGTNINVETTADLLETISVCKLNGIAEHKGVACAQKTP